MKSEADYYIFAISAKTKEYMSLYRQYPYLNPRYLRSVYFMTLGCLDSAHKHLVMSLTQESLCFIRCFFSLLPRRLSSYLLCKELQISNCVPYVMRDVIYPELLLDEPPGAALSGSSSGAVPATGFGHGDHDSSGTRIPEGTGSTERLLSCGMQSTRQLSALRKPLPPPAPAPALTLIVVPLETLILVALGYIFLL